MDKNTEFTNPNYHPEDFIFSSEIKLPPGKTGLPAVDAANKLSAELDEARKNSLVDSLTGCYNRNYFEKFKTENFNPDRDHHKIGLVFADVNNLKKINDTQGHKFGDKLIKHAADFLKSSFRKDDLVVRLGGDEFLIICHNDGNDPDFSVNLPKKVTEKLTKNLLKEKNKKNSLSLAFGIAVYDKNQDFSNLDKTKDRADLQMYRNKKEMKVTSQV